MPNIIIIHGAMASGKSTITNELVKSKELKGYVFLDKAYIKDTMLKIVKKKERQLAKGITNEVMSLMIKKLLPSGYNLLIQEMRASSIKKKFSKEIKKYHYKVKSFYLQCLFDTVKKRYVKRQLSRGNKPDYESLREMHDKHAYPDEEDIIIDTGKNNPKKAVQLIINELGL